MDDNPFFLLLDVNVENSDQLLEQEFESFKRKNQAIQSCFDGDLDAEILLEILDFEGANVDALLEEVCEALL